MKKSLRFILILSFAMIVLSAAVFAQGTGVKETVLDKLWGALKFLFFDFSQSSEATIATGLKAFMFVLLFALLYGLSEIGPLHSFGKNVRITLSITLSLMSVLLIPARLVIALASAYSAVFFGGMLAALILAAVFLIFKVFKEPTVHNRFAKAIICGIFTGVVGSFSDLTAVGGGGIGFTTMSQAALKSLSTVTDVAEFATLIFFILTIVYLIGAFTSLSHSKYKEHEGTVEDVKNWWNRPKTPEQIEKSSKKELTVSLDALKAYSIRMTKLGRTGFSSYPEMFKQINTYVALVNNLEVSIGKLSKVIPPQTFNDLKNLKDFIRDFEAIARKAEAEPSKIGLFEFVKSSNYKVKNMTPQDALAEMQCRIEDNISPAILKVI